MKPKIKLYTLSACIHCQNTKKFLDAFNADYSFVDVDQLKGKEREAVINEIRKLKSDIAFPTIVIGDRVIVGFNEAEIKKAMGMQ